MVDENLTWKPHIAATQGTLKIVVNIENSMSTWNIRCEHRKLMGFRRFKLKDYVNNMYSSHFIINSQP